MRADEAFLELLLAPAGERAALARRAADSYTTAARRYMLHTLKYYVTKQQQDALFPASVNRSNVDELAANNPQQLEQIASAVIADAMKDPMGSEHFDDVREYARFIERAQARIRTLSPALAWAGAEQ
jgi:hypothetical protein